MKDKNQSPNKPAPAKKHGHTPARLRVLALALCLVLVLSSCALPFDLFDLPAFLSGDSRAGSNPTGAIVPSDPDPYVPEMGNRRTIHYDEMAYQRPDFDALRTRMLELTEAMKQVADFDSLMEMDNEVSDLYEAFDTMDTLCYIRSRQDVSDTFFEEERRWFDEVGVEQSLLLNDFNRVIVEGPFAEEYRAEMGDYIYDAIVNSLMLNAESVQEYLKERSALETDYDRMLTTLTVEEDGATYTLEDIDNLDYDSYFRLRDSFFAQHADSFATLFARMIELDKLTASTLGFSSPISMYYLSHNRDYTPEEAQQLFENVKRYFVPLLSQVLSSSYSAGAMELDTTMQRMGTALDYVHPQLREAWDFMNAFGLYDVEARADKMVGSQFTTVLSGYDAPFIYTYWRNDFSSATTLMHEFGHFYDFWLHYDVDTVHNMDISEVYSQALELLMAPTYDMFTKYAEEAELSNLQSMLINSIVYQSLLEEFLFRAYEMDNPDATSLARLFSELLGEYGLSYGTGLDHSWLEVPHLFTAPFYTISYVTSAVAALQIWAVSQADWQSGIDVYMDLIHADQNQPFSQLLESVGLGAAHKPEVLQEVAGYFEVVFAG